MTPPISECPASSELLASSSRSQGISGGGVRNGALLAPLCSHCGSEAAGSEKIKVKDPPHSRKCSKDETKIPCRDSAKRSVLE